MGVGKRQLLSWCMPAIECSNKPATEEGQSSNCLLGFNRPNQAAQHHSTRGWHRWLEPASQLACRA